MKGTEAAVEVEKLIFNLTVEMGAVMKGDRELTYQQQIQTISPAPHGPWLHMLAHQESLPPRLLKIHFDFIRFNAEFQNYFTNLDLVS